VYNRRRRTDNNTESLGMEGKAKEKEGLPNTLFLANVGENMKYCI